LLDPAVEASVGHSFGRGHVHAGELVLPPLPVPGIAHFVFSSRLVSDWSQNIIGRRRWLTEASPTSDPKHRPPSPRTSDPTRLCGSPPRLPPPSGTGREAAWWWDQCRVRLRPTSIHPR